MGAVCDRAGFGVLLSYQVEEQLTSGKLQIVLADYEPSPLLLSVVYSHAKRMSTRVRVFEDWVTKELRAELSKS